jgi:hypothetical protein
MDALKVGWKNQKTSHTERPSVDSCELATDEEKTDSQSQASPTTTVLSTNSIMNSCVLSRKGQTAQSNDIRCISYISQSLNPLVLPTINPYPHFTNEEPGVRERVRD